MKSYFSDGFGLFPDVSQADKDGFLIAGGSLATDRLIAAYEQGIFPWYSEDTPILWYATDPRFVLYPQKIKISKSMRSVLRNSGFELSQNHAFEEVIRNCAAIKRKNQNGTWILEEIIEAYTRLHEMNYAQSLEVWKDGKLVGGLYGMDMGHVFCGESMFSLESNASKVALIHLCQNFNYQLIDCQIYTSHLAKMGAEMISLSSYLKILQSGNNR